MNDYNFSLEDLDLRGMFAGQILTNKKYNSKTEREFDRVPYEFVIEEPEVSYTIYWTEQIEDSSTFVSDKFSAFKKEQQAFESMKAELKKEYAEKYVAIHGGCVVDSDVDESVLIDRFYKKYGNVPVYIDKIGEKRVIKMRSPRRLK